MLPCCRGGRLRLAPAAWMQGRAQRLTSPANGIAKAIGFAPGFVDKAGAIRLHRLCLPIIVHTGILQLFARRMFSRLMPPWQGCQDQHAINGVAPTARIGITRFLCMLNPKLNHRQSLEKARR